jgi:hypothetical protein
MEIVLQDLPNSGNLLRRVGRVRNAVVGALNRKLSQDELHGFIDRLQLALARINDELARTYFLGELALAKKGATAIAQTQSQNQAQDEAETELYE